LRSAIRTALEQLETLQSAPPNDAEALELLGDCHLAKKDHALAAEAYTKVMQTEPARRAVYVKLARLLESKPEARPGAGGKTADEVMDLLVARNPGEFRAYLSRWAFREKKIRPPAKLPPEVSRTRMAAELAPEEADAAGGRRCTTARVNSRRRARLTEGRTRHPRDARFVQSLYRLEIQTAGGCRSRSSRDARRPSRC
jgi:hypothetical protein